MVNGGEKRIRIVLTLPRCGTHFIWSRLVQSGRYQLIYDADRIPALEVLSQKYDGKLGFLCPAPSNPNYNFQFNSLAEVQEPLSAAEHLDRLKEKYGVADSFELFRKLTALQDNGDRVLFSVNRFVYTCANDHFRGSGFEWTVDFAMESLRLLHAWLTRLGYPVQFSLVVRRMDDWIRSQTQRRGADQLEVLHRRLDGLPQLLETCRELDIPVFEMGDVVRAMNEGQLEFESAVEPLSRSRLREMESEAASKSSVLAPGPTSTPALFRAGRFIEYLRETDPIKRTSLVRSIGYLPVRMSALIPVIGRQIRQDCDGIILNNARICANPNGES